jgi:nucleotide-binding universal stress UspA family protein
VTVSEQDETPRAPRDESGGAPEQDETPRAPGDGNRASEPVIICYDGSKQAIAALDTAARLLPGAPAVVVTVWKPILQAILAVSLGPAPQIADPVDADESQRRAAISFARDGARRASKAGMQAEPLAVRATGAIWEAIEDVAHDRHARLIVCGTSRSGVKSALLDSVPAALVYRASRPVMVVPSAEAAAERERESEERQRSAHRRPIPAAGAASAIARGRRSRARPA